MREYRELWNTTTDEINEHATDGWTVHSFGNCAGEGDIFTWALMEREKPEERKSQESAFEEKWRT